MYLPWHMSGDAAVLAEADYTISPPIYSDKRRRLERKGNQYLFHGAWAYRRTRREVFPLLSRIQNIGYEQGENGRSPTWYRANH